MPGDIRIGTCAWSHDEWRGNFYPEHLPAARRLERYARRFATVEVDSTFYGVPQAHALGHWLDGTPENFSFACKLPREITHERHLRDCREPLEEFLRDMAPLHSRLGCFLAQLPPAFVPPRDEHALRTFVAELPRGFRFAVEFRNAEWHLPRVVSLLEEHNVCWVWNDLTSAEEQNRACFEFLPQTADFLYLRLLGDIAGAPQPRTSGLDNWAMKIEKHAAEAAPVFVFLGNHFEGHAPLSAQRLASRLGITLPEPSDGGSQMKLF